MWQEMLRIDQRDDGDQKETEAQGRIENRSVSNIKPDASDTR